MRDEVSRSIYVARRHSDDMEIDGSLVCTLTATGQDYSETTLILTEILARVQAPHQTLIAVSSAFLRFSIFAFAFCPMIPPPQCLLVSSCLAS